MQDVVFGFKATELFRIADLAECNTAARAVGQQAWTSLAQTKETSLGTVACPAQTATPAGRNRLASIKRNP